MDPIYTPLIVTNFELVQHMNRLKKVSFMHECDNFFYGPNVEDDLSMKKMMMMYNCPPFHTHSSSL